MTAPLRRTAGFSPAPPDDEVTDDRDVLPLSRAQQAAALPDPTVLLTDQVGEARGLLLEDRSTYPRYPWRDLAQLAGPMCPEDLILFAARTGGGKSLLLTNLFDALITAGRCGLYAGLEQSPKVLRTKWACLRAGVHPQLVLAPRDDEEGTPRHIDAVQRVDAELLWQTTRPVREAAHFSAARRINATGLRRWTTWAVERGAEFVIVDHIDRIQHGDGKNAFHEVSETVRLAKELAVEFGIVMLVASQVGRPGDAVEAFMPPALHNLRGAGTKEEEADTVFGIFRPLKPDVGAKEITRVRQGFANADTIIEPHQMGVRVLKHRLDGAAMGKAVRLAVEHGRVTDLAERDRYGTSYDGRRRI